MHELQQFADQLNWRVCAKRIAERRRDHERNVGLHVLGSRMSIIAACLHRTSEFVRGWRRRRRNYVQHSDPDAAAASELIGGIALPQKAQEKLLCFLWLLPKVVESHQHQM